MKYLQIIQIKYVHSMIPMLTKSGLSLDTELVDLADLIGRKMRVHVEQEEFAGRKYNNIDEYLAVK